MALTVRDPEPPLGVGWNDGGALPKVSTVLADLREATALDALAN
jgi:hypothetical protein